MNLRLPPRKRFLHAYRNRHPSPPPSPPPPPPPPPFVAVVHRRRRTPYVTFRKLLDTNGSMSRWERRSIRPQNFGGFQELRRRLYRIAGANNMGVIYGHQAVIYYLTHQQLLVNRNQPFKLLDLVWNWDTFANSVHRFRIVWVPLNTNQSKSSTNKSKSSTNRRKKSTSRNTRYPNETLLLSC